MTRLFFLAALAVALVAMWPGAAQAGGSIGWGEVAEDAGLSSIALAVGILLVAIVVTGILFMINPGAAIALIAAVILGGVWASRAEEVRDLISGGAAAGASVSGYVADGGTPATRLDPAAVVGR